MPSVTALIAAGTSVGGAITSFAQASEQAAKIKAAEAAAEKAMAEAKKILDVNVYKGLEVEMLPFNLQREDLAALGGQAITAAQEGGRGASETAGRVLAGAQEQDRAIAAQLSGQMDELNKLTAAEESNLQKQKAELELAEVSGAQQAQADAERNMSAAIASGISGLADFGLTLYKESPLYKPTIPVKPKKEKTIKTEQIYTPPTYIG